MATDALQRFREETRRLRSAEAKPQGDLLDQIQAGALAFASASKSYVISKGKKRLEQLLEQIRTAAEEFRVATERHIAGVLALADEAARIWEARWEAALRDHDKDRATEAEMLQWVLEDAGQALQEALRDAREYAPMFDRPLTRIDELEVKAAEFPLWARERLARWEILGLPALTLDPERIARAQTAYARGDHEELADVLSRVQAGGSWVRE
ncbi:MAG TPA: hypothetical protein DDY78_14265 [Planctomycetales bacterium]|nr:hypothetical protein [Planctomycetales bacterium]